MKARRRAAAVAAPHHTIHRDEQVVGDAHIELVVSQEVGTKNGAVNERGRVRFPQLGIG